LHRVVVTIGVSVVTFGKYSKSLVSICLELQQQVVVAEEQRLPVAVVKIC